MLTALLAALVALAAAPARAAGEPSVGHRRIVDIELHPLLSIPDALGVCVEGFPLRRGLSVIGCGSIQVFLAAAVNLALVYRFPLVESPTFQLGLGPAAGSHAIADNLRGPWIDVSADGYASLEAVWWGEGVGFQLQTGLGAMYMVWDQPSGINDRWVPIVDVTLGIALRTKGQGTPQPTKTFWGR
jgi:hypothetical protein